MKVSACTRTPRTLHLYVDEAFIPFGRNQRHTALGGLVVFEDLDHIAPGPGENGSVEPRLSSIMDELWAREVWAQPHSADRRALKGGADCPELARLDSDQKTNEAQRLIREASMGRLGTARFFVVCLSDSVRSDAESAREADFWLLRLILETLELRASDTLHVHAEPRSELDSPRRMKDYLQGLLVCLAASYSGRGDIPRLVSGRGNVRGNSKTDRSINPFGFGIVDHFLRAVRPALRCARPERERAFRRLIRNWSFQHDPVMKAKGGQWEAIQQEWRDQGSDAAFA